MTLFQAFLLGALQGLTEFLPISSSGHLVLAQSFMNLDVVAMKSFDIAVHFGTLLAIIVYFWKDILELWQGFWGYVRGVRGAKASESMQKSQILIWYLIVATIPAILITLLFEKKIDEFFYNPVSVATFTLVVGIGFFVVESIASHLKKTEIRFRQALIVGFAQVLALMPGVSRSGITISAGLLQGVKREEAARFSFLLGGVAILAGACYAVVEILRGKYSMPEPSLLITGILTSFAFGLAAVSFLMKFLKKHTLVAFGVYRIILGILLLYFIQ